MTEMKFETIKRKALDEFLVKVRPYLIGPHDTAVFLALLAQIEDVTAGGPVRPATQILEEWEAYGRTLIDKWDVRCVGKLIECFPSCVPAHWKGRKLTAYMADDEDCTWVVAPCA
jgi:hypothetical protein